MPAAHKGTLTAAQLTRKHSRAARAPPHCCRNHRPHSRCPEKTKRVGGSLTQAPSTRQHAFSSWFSPHTAGASLTSRHFSKTCWVDATAGPPTCDEPAPVLVEAHLRAGVGLCPRKQHFLTLCGYLTLCVSSSTILVYFVNWMLRSRG